MESWKRPELIVFARGRPEEVVLTACKHCQVIRGPMGSGIEFCIVQNTEIKCSENGPS